jgi:hypothetical protein
VNRQPDAADLEAFRRALAEKLRALGISPDDLEPSPDLMEPFDADEESLAARAEIATRLAEVAAQQIPVVLGPSEEELNENPELEAWFAGVGPFPTPKPLASLAPARSNPRSREHRTRRTRRTRRVRVRSGSRGDPPDDDPDSEPPLVRGRAARGRLGVEAA